MKYFDKHVLNFEKNQKSFEFLSVFTVLLTGHACDQAHDHSYCISGFVNERLVKFLKKYNNSGLNAEDFEVILEDHENRGKTGDLIILHHLKKSIL